MRIVAGSLTLLLLLAVLSFRMGQSAAPVSVGEPQPVWLKLTFGLDEKAVSWDGRLKVHDGKILQSLSWSRAPKMETRKLAGSRLQSLVILG